MSWSGSNTAGLFGILPTKIEDWSKIIYPPARCTITEACHWDTSHHWYLYNCVRHHNFSSEQLLLTSGLQWGSRLPPPLRQTGASFWVCTHTRSLRQLLSTRSAGFILEGFLPWKRLTCVADAVAQQHSLCFYRKTIDSTQTDLKPCGPSQHTQLQFCFAETQVTITRGIARRPHLALFFHFMVTCLPASTAVVRQIAL